MVPPELDASSSASSLLLSDVSVASGSDVDDVDVSSSPLSASLLSSSGPLDGGAQPQSVIAEQSIVIVRMSILASLAQSGFVAIPNTT